MKKTLILVVITLFFACQKQPLVPTVYNIDKDLEPFLKTFTDEVKLRGIDIKLENLILVFGATSKEICGQCEVLKSNGQRTIIINNDQICWKNAVKENREALVFHELGHCLLERSHRDDKLPNGDVASIMNSNYQISGPYEPCIYTIAGDNSCNKTTRRAYYIDELVNTKTSVPSWGK